MKEKSDLVKYLTSASFLPDKQHGFHLSMSIADVITVITELHYQASDKNDKTRAVVLDISKAFNSVLYVELLHKLKGYGCSGWICDVNRSLLTNRSIKVVWTVMVLD